MVEHATRLFLKALPRRIRLAEVADRLGCAPGALWAAYARQGLNPRHHLRRARFVRLHAELSAGRWATLAEALSRWGFPPSSPDACDDYRKLYGRHPQQTLDDARSKGREEVDAFPASCSVVAVLGDDKRGAFR